MTLYAIRPVPGTDSLDEDAEVVDQLRYGWQFLEQVITVWRLVDKERADKIEAIKDRVSLAAGDDEIRFYAEDLQNLVDLLTGVDDAVIAAGIVDRHWRVPAERLEELAKQVPAMDLATERSLKSKTSALGEVMINAVSIRNFLSNAVDAGCVVVLG
jgi:ATP phosphoribosyltransferase